MSEESAGLDFQAFSPRRAGTLVDCLPMVSLVMNPLAQRRHWFAHKKPRRNSGKRTITLTQPILNSNEQPNGSLLTKKNMNPFSSFRHLLLLDFCRPAEGRRAVNSAHRGGETPSMLVNSILESRCQFCFHLRMKHFGTCLYRSTISNFVINENYSHI